MKPFSITLFNLFYFSVCFASSSNDSDVLKRRGYNNVGDGTVKPNLTLDSPATGWSTSQMIMISGKCSDKKASPISVNINGAQYFTLSHEGSFSRSFPAAKGKNNIVVECKNKGGITQETRTVDAQIPMIGLKVVLTNDTDSAYTDLHIYEPDGSHVYWVNTKSDSGGVFFLNKEGDSFDQAGYGPYIYTVRAPLVGTYRIDTNYWPGGARQHTLAHLNVILNEGSASEVRRETEYPLARPGETITLAYVTIRGNGLPPLVYIPRKDPPEKAPKISKEILDKWNRKQNGDSDEVINNQVFSVDEASVNISPKIFPLYGNQIQTVSVEKKKRVF